jgi:hypothetical protein
MKKQIRNEMQPQGRSRGLYHLRFSVLAKIPAERPPYKGGWREGPLRA